MGGMGDVSSAAEFGSPRIFPLWSGQGDSPADTSGRGCRTPARPHTCSTTLLPMPNSSPRAQLRPAVGDSSPVLAGNTGL